MKPAMKLKSQRGFAILTAIFLLVVLAALGAFAVNVSMMQHIGSAQDVQSVRAYQAARAGIEWGLYRLQPQNGSNCPATTNMTLTGEAFAGLVVTVTCVSSGAPAVIQIAAVACNQPVGSACPNTTGPSNVYVERRLDAILRID